MTPATAPDVLDNVHDPLAHCPYCCNEGMVPVNLRPSPKVLGLHQGRPIFHATENTGGEDWREYAAEEYGPCPACTRGHAIETQRWPSGFWKGRPWWLSLHATCRCKADASPPPADVMGRIRAWTPRDVEDPVPSTPGDEAVDEAPAWAEGDE